MTKPDEALVEVLLATSQSLTGIAIRAVQGAPTEITVSQHRVLVLLDDEGPLGIGVIARELGVNPSNATRLCDRLQRLGLIARARSEEDRRSVLVAVTDAGRRLVAQVRARRREEITKVVDRIDVLATPAVVQALDAVNQAAREVELEVTGRGRDRSASS